MSRLDEIKARAEQVHWTSTSVEQAMARITSSAADVPWLVAQVDRLEAWRAEALGIIDYRGEQQRRAEDERDNALAEVARLTAERDALAAQVKRVEALAGQWERMAATAINPDSREWLQACSETLHECLSGWPKMSAALAGSTGQEAAPDAGHKCEPYYSRAECGWCGWQEQWCVTCRRQMCGCATDAMGADQ